MEGKPIIGVTPLFDDEKDSIWMLPGYLDGLVACGALPIILPLDAEAADTEAMLALCDGILLTGGHDVDPSLYEEKRLSICGPSHRGRDRMEHAILERALMVDMPLLGICRGAQFINAALGGTLYQDIALQMPEAISHSMTPPYSAFWHEVSLTPDTPLYALLRKKTIRVNSCHHQGIRSLSFQLSPMAYAPDGLVEAFRYPSKRFVWAVQWHPECLWNIDGDQRSILQAFVDACADGDGDGAEPDSTNRNKKRAQRARLAFRARR